MPRLALLAPVALLAACAADAADFDRDPAGGKADDLVCEGAGLDGNGYCRLPNGRFAASACCEDTAVECTFAVRSPLGDTSFDVAEHVVAGREVSIDDIDSLSALDARQMFAAALHLEMMDPTEDFDVVFEVADEGLFELLEVEHDDGETFTPANWVRFFAGDNEVGVIFAAGTTEMIAEISDGDLMHCE